MFDIATITRWISLLENLRAAGKPAIDAVRDALAAHGIEADNALLDGVIADATRREALAEREAGLAPANLGPAVGSPGD